MSTSPDRSAITVKHVSKNFLLPHEKIGTVKGLFTSVFHRRGSTTKEVQHALRDVNFEVRQGEFFGIVGRNGSGKSTMLKLLAGIYQPTKGSISVRGKLVPFIELGVGFNPELTGRENVYLNGALLGFSRQEVARMYDGIVAFAELERFMDQKLKNYSSGMQVRLAFSVAIMANADILLIDEVLAVGDADFQRKCFEYFKSLKKRKKTVVFVSHDMGAVREYCDRAVLIDSNELVHEGSAEEIAEAYTRLFNDDEPEQPEEPAGGEKRWGDGTVVSRAVSLDEPLYDGQTATIKLTVEVAAHQDIEDPVFGFLVKDAADNALFGTNSRIKGMKTGVLHAGEHRRLIWEIPNILADGRHFVDVTIEHADGVTVCDWWTEAASFMVRKKERTAYHITPPIEVRLQAD